MSTLKGKVVVNRAMSLDGFIAGPEDEMSWIRDLAPKETLAELAGATGTMLVGRRTWDVGDRMEADEPGTTDYPFTGPMFLLTHRPLDRPDRGVTILTGDIGDAVATALAAGGGKNLEILGADVAARPCGAGSSTRSSRTSCRWCSETAFRSRPRAEGRPGTDQQHAVGEPPPSFVSGSAGSPVGHVDG